MVKDKMPKIKIVVIGDMNVGKSAIIGRFLNDIFDPEIKNTIGVDFRSKKMKFGEEWVRV